ncbi:MAG TPA: HAD-IB family phosphatase [Gemmatimonadaceae bacterium]|jgi:phosphoserine phosphatase|nr:HAD-IB family phosphatase [Gemmatimonadaceae bacterium]
MPRFRTVLLDCDSTLSAIEGIDELAAHCREEVAALTDAAMRGRIALEDVYGRRLELVRPTRAAVDALGRKYVERLVPDARETVAALQAAGVDVRVISGGLLPAVRAVADAVAIAPDRVAAVDIRFSAQGEYAGFDAASPLAATGGKRVAIERWNVGRPAAMVGDGSTDLEARPVVDLFVAFAGVIERPAVVNAADVIIRANSLAPLLPLVVNVDELPTTSHRSVYHRGAALGAAVTTSNHATRNS